jgi:hypothetical protein
LSHTQLVRTAHLLTACLLSLLIPSLAHAQDGRIVFARGGALWQQGADGKGEATQIADLPDDATEVRAIEPFANAHLLVLDMEAYAAWVVWPGAKGAGELRGGACTGRAHASPRGTCLLCPGPKGMTLASATRDRSSTVGAELDEAFFLGTSGDDLVGRSGSEIVALDRRKPKATRVVAKNGLVSSFLPAPDGSRAVAVFGSGDTARVRSFLLDGEGVSRQLGGPGVPVVWSPDSQWVVIQEGILPDDPSMGDPGDESGAIDDPVQLDPWLLGAPAKKSKKKPKKPPEPPPPTTRACVARAVGGEVKCWDDYHGLAFSPDSTLVLLKKERSLYVGKIAGVKPEPPVKILDEVDGAATWVPTEKLVEL